MQETLNSCFGSKINSTILRQAKTVKYECRNITATYGTRLYLSSPDEGLCFFFSIRNNCCEFLASYGVILQNDIQPYFKTPVCGAPFSYYFIVLFLYIADLTYLFIIWQSQLKQNLHSEHFCS